MKTSMTLKLSKRLSLVKRLQIVSLTLLVLLQCWYSCQLQLFTVITTMACRLLVGMSIFDISLVFDVHVINNLPFNAI